MLYTSSIVLGDQLCLTGDFDSQLQHVLQERMLTPQDIAIMTRVLEDVVPTLNKRWQDYQIFPFGSLTSGLGTKSSDSDFYIRLKNSSLDMGYVLNETKLLFEEQPSLYTDLRAEFDRRYTLFTFFHIPSQRSIDIVFKFGDVGLQNSKLIRYFFSLDARFLALGNILKFWFQIHGLIGAVTLPSYAVYILIIFYLQQKNMAPPVNILQRDSISLFIDSWDMSFNEIPYDSTNKDTVYELLGGFFKYYSEFNFEEYIVSPFVGRPIPRSAFQNIENFPEEFSLYKNIFKHKLQLDLKPDVNIKTDLCIQDPLQHNSNTGFRLSHEDSTKFKSLLKSVSKLFDELPSDKFLRAYLTVDQNNSTVNGISNQSDCIEVTVH